MLKNGWILGHIKQALNAIPYPFKTHKNINPQYFAWSYSSNQNIVIKWVLWEYFAKTILKN
jgi:hypothetical protein